MSNVRGPFWREFRGQDTQLPIGACFCPGHPGHNTIFRTDRQLSSVSCPRNSGTPPELGTGCKKRRTESPWLRPANSAAGGGMTDDRCFGCWGRFQGEARTCVCSASFRSTLLFAPPSAEVNPCRIKYGAIPKNRAPRSSRAETVPLSCGKVSGPSRQKPRNTVDTSGGAQSAGRFPGRSRPAIVAHRYGLRYFLEPHFFFGGFFVSFFFLSRQPQVLHIRVPPLCRCSQNRCYSTPRFVLRQVLIWAIVLQGFSAHAQRRPRRSRRERHPALGLRRRPRCRGRRARHRPRRWPGRWRGRRR